MSIYGELSSFSQEWVELYEIDVTKFGQPIIRLHSGVNESYDPVVWQGHTYLPFPIEASGFEISNQKIARPKVVVSNVSGVLSASIRDFNSFLGCKFTRKRTMVKYLDTVNFIDGNPTADSTQHLPDDVFYIYQKTSETKYQVEFELSSALDLQGVMLPRRQVIANLCPFAYRSEECGYVGGPVASVFDTATTSTKVDDCSKTVKGCKFRFGEYGELSFGGFVGSALIKES